MRKDFLVAPVQVYEARAGGAGGVLLITRLLDNSALTSMLDAAAEMGLFALVECFDAHDAERTTEAIAGRRQQLLVGVNTRDLRTLEVVGDRLARMAPHLPQGVPWVAESGMATVSDVGRAAALGYRVALVGTALMRAADPGALVAQMKAAGRAECG
jgi:indole-3-glycerol phosphate synthase